MGSKTLVGTEYVKQHNTLKVIESIKMGCRKWTAPRRYKVVQNKVGLWKNNWKNFDWEELFWDWENPMKTECTAYRTDLSLGDTSKSNTINWYGIFK